MKYDHIIAKAVKSLVLTNGASINLKGEIPTTGFMVSIPNHEQIVNSDLSNLMVELEHYIFKHERLLQNPLYYLGLWQDKAGIYIDISQRFEHKQFATSTGKKWKQIAIYDVLHEESIYLK